MSSRVIQVPDIDALLSHMFTDLQQHPEKAEGAGQLLFEMCKGVRHMFHSCAEKVCSFTGINLHRFRARVRIGGKKASFHELQSLNCENDNVIKL